MNEMTWMNVDFLATFTGTVFMTNIITHFIKDYLPEELDRKIIALFVAMVITTTTNSIIIGLDFKTIYISIINSFLVAAAAIGNYDILIHKMKKSQVKEIMKEHSQEEAAKGQRDQ